MLQCDLRAGQICSGVQFGFPQEWQLRVDDFFFLSVSNGLRFRAGLVKATCSPLEELPGETLLGFLFFCFLSPYFRLYLSSSMVSRTVRSSSDPLMNLSRAFLSLIAAANLYVKISSGIFWLNSHFLLISSNLFQYSSSVSSSSGFTLKNYCALLWNTFRAGMNVFLNNFNSSCKLTSFSSMPH